MSELATWLLSDQCKATDVRDIVVTIRGKRYEGAAYKQGDDTRPRLYLLGELPASYRRSSRTRFTLEGADWCIAGYMQENPIPARFAAYHPFGRYFMLFLRSLPDGTAIDQYQPRPYNRFPMTVETV